MHAVSWESRYCCSEPEMPRSALRGGELATVKKAARMHNGTAAFIFESDMKTPIGLILMVLRSWDNPHF